MVSNNGQKVNYLDWIQRFFTINDASIEPILTNSRFSESDQSGLIVKSIGRMVEDLDEFTLDDCSKADGQLGAFLKAIDVIEKQNSLTYKHKVVHRGSYRIFNLYVLPILKEAMIVHL